MHDLLDSPTYRLSPREAEVLLALANGLTQAQTARQLYISRFTVRNHATNIIVALGALSITNAVHIAHERKLI